LRLAKGGDGIAPPQTEKPFYSVASVQLVVK